MTARAFLVLGVAIAALVLIPRTHAESASETACNDRPVDDWLLGHWRTGENVDVVFRRDDANILWRYVRRAGVMTQRWGEKEPAEAEGRVASIAGCAIVMRGVYTSYANSKVRSSRSAVGEPMMYEVTYDGRASLIGRGIGHGKEYFDTRFMKKGAPSGPAAPKP